MEAIGEAMRAFNAINKYRRANWFYRHRLGFVAKLYELRIYRVHNCFISSRCHLGDGTRFGYKGIGCVIGKSVTIGRNCMISQNVTIGGRGGHEQMPHIGDNCYIGAGAKVLGPIKIGDNVVIGAGAVMISDAPPNTVWAGVPAKCIKTISKKEPFSDF